MPEVSYCLTHAFETRERRGVCTWHETLPSADTECRGGMTSHLDRVPGI